MTISMKCWMKENEDCALSPDGHLTFLYFTAWGVFYQAPSLPKKLDLETRLRIRNRSKPHSQAPPPPKPMLIIRSSIVPLPCSLFHFCPSLARLPHYVYLWSKNRTKLFLKRWSDGFGIRFSLVPRPHKAPGCRLLQGTNADMHDTT